MFTHFMFIDIFAFDFGILLLFVRYFFLFFFRRLLHFCQ